MFLATQVEQIIACLAIFFLPQQLPKVDDGSTLCIVQLYLLVELRETVLL